MKSGTLTVLAAFGGALSVAAALSACAGPRPLAKAIDRKDDEAYMSMLKGGAVSPRDAFLAERAGAAGISSDEAARRDDALSASSNPFSAGNDLSAVSRGAVIFSHECASCHGDNADGNGPAMPVPMPATSFRRNALRWDITMRGGPVAKWFKTIREGATSQVTRADGSSTTVVMPPFEQRLSREQTWLVITYLQSVDDGKSAQEKTP